MVLIIDEKVQICDMLKHDYSYSIITQKYNNPKSIFNIIGNEEFIRFKDRMMIREKG